MGDTLFFAADDGTRGRELWKSDGTEPGTVLVKNIRPNDSGRRPGSRPANLTAVGDTLFFTANDGTRGPELWKSDGSRAGTVLVKDIAPAGFNSPTYLTAVGRRLFFSASDGTRGEELWKSDGSRAGTVLVKNIAPKTAFYPGSYPSELTAMGRQLFFAADDGTRGAELWRSNGSRAGTVLVKDIDPVVRDDDPHYPGSRPYSLTPMGRRLFFSADDGTHGGELWRSDGSRAGTDLVKDIDPGGAWSTSWPSSLTVMGDQVFFSANDGTRGAELWRSDGSRAGTVLVKNIDPNDEPNYYSGSHPSSLTAIGDQVFFAAELGSSGEGLWKSDGSRAGTALVKSIDLRGSYDSGYSVLTAMEGQLFFAADDGTHGEELWRSDGTPEGTVLVKNIDPCDDSEYLHGSRPSSLTAIGSRLFFAADDGTHGEELWTSDGTPEGTVLIKDIKTGTTP